MEINATLIGLFHICKRETWLHAQGIRMEHTSNTVAEGKLIHETSYPQRAERYTELQIGGSKIDYYEAQNKIVHETKKSNKMEVAHAWQLKFYLYLLQTHGIEGATGILEYPKLRKTTHVTLSESDIMYLKACEEEIRRLTENETCPPTINKPICKNCSYYELCYISE